MNVRFCDNILQSYIDYFLTYLRILSIHAVLSLSTFLSPLV